MTRAHSILQQLEERRVITLSCPATSRKSVAQIKDLLDSLDIEYNESTTAGTFFAEAPAVDTDKEQKLHNVSWRGDISVT